MQHSGQNDTAGTESTGNKSDTTKTENKTQPDFTDSKLKTEEFILLYPGKQHAAFRQYIEELRKQWQKVSNPITATYQGNDFGDYFHILFKDVSGTTYDFGQAKNNYGPYKLFDNSGQYDDNPEYLGKKFKVYWDWQVADFYCCEGEYGKARAYLPTITKLELLTSPARPLSVDSTGK